jgi:hypothetical protein
MQKQTHYNKQSEMILLAFDKHTKYSRENTSEIQAVFLT